MITPLDIQNKEFAKAVRGYKEEEVDMFLDLITLDFEKLAKENIRLKTEVSALETELEKYKGAEGEVIKVLEQARQLMGDISVSAEKRAEILLRNAELDAELTVREARDRAERLVDENKTLEKRYGEFRNKYKKMLEDELARFENLDEDLYPHFNDNKLEDLINAPLRQEVSDLEKTLFADTAPVGEVEVDDKKTVVVNMKGVEAE